MISFRLIVIIAILLVFNYSQEIDYVFHAGTSTGTLLTDRFLLTKIYSTTPTYNVTVCRKINSSEQCVGANTGRKVGIIRNVLDVIKLYRNETPPKIALFTYHLATSCQIYGWGTSSGIGTEMKVVSVEKLQYVGAGKINYATVCTGKLYETDVGAGIICKGLLVAIIFQLNNETSGTAYSVSKLLQLIEQGLTSVSTERTTNLTNSSKSVLIELDGHWITVFILTAVLVLYYSVMYTCKVKIKVD